MSQTKSEFALQKINDLVDKIIAREDVDEGHTTWHDLQWVKFYAKDLAAKCEGCAEAPHGHEEDKDS